MQHDNPNPGGATGRLWRQRLATIVTAGLVVLVPAGWAAAAVGAAAPGSAPAVVPAPVPASVPVPAPAPPAKPSAAGPAAADPPAASFLSFSTDFGATCVSRNGLQVLVRNTHPTRTLRVWLDRFHMGVGTGDRSRTDLPPGAEPDLLGCSRSANGVQEWRVVRAVFVD